VQKARAPRRYDRTMTDEDIESLERATLAAVPPTELLALDGWLVALDPGTVGRAHSAVPTRHTAVSHDLVETIEGHYARAGLRPSLRMPRVPGSEAARERLRERGYAARQPTLTQAGTVDGLLRLAASHAVQLDAQPADGWAQVFLGAGFDPVDGASRVAILRRGRENMFASVRLDGSVVAVGSACFSQGWCGIHGMRTSRDVRGRGLATAILGAFGRLARDRGVDRVFLQVEEANAAARSLYERAGFRTLWCSEYWRRG
jgi:ribosomal protein S18 acetylase RimI-like enzyme